MRKIAITTLLLTLVCATSLLSAQTESATAQTPHNPATFVQHRVNYLTTVLSLSSAQQAQATTIFTGAANNMSSIHSEMKTTRQSLQTAVKNNDTAQINQLSSTMGGLAGQMIQSRATAKAAFYQTLTPEQQTKLTQLESQRHGWGHKGMGGEF